MKITNKLEVLAQDYKKLVYGTPEYTAWSDAVHQVDARHDYEWSDIQNMAEGLQGYTTIDEDSMVEVADNLVDVYNSDLAAWLGKDTRNGTYVDAAISDLGYPESKGIFGAIAYGQYQMYEEIGHAILNYLEA